MKAATDARALLLHVNKPNQSMRLPPPRSQASVPEGVGVVMGRGQSRCVARARRAGREGGREGGEEEEEEFFNHRKGGLFTIEIC
jgi:hypothetical protein